MMAHKSELIDGWSGSQEANGSVVVAGNDADRLAATISGILAETTREVFELMVMMQVNALPQRSHRPLRFHQSVSAVLGLSGGLRGMLAVHCPASLACAVCGSMLGETPSEVDADVRDTVGEIANMLAGGLKARLQDLGRRIELAVPSVIAGQSYEVNLLSRAEMILLPFVTAEGEFLLEFKYAD